MIVSIPLDKGKIESDMSISFGRCSYFLIKDLNSNSNIIKNTAIKESGGAGIKAAENYCDNKEIIFLGKIPYDKLVSKAINEGKSILDLNSLVSKAIVDIYTKLKKNIGGNNYENSISM